MRFANVMSITTMINTLCSDNSNIANVVDTLPQQIMTTITNRILTFKPMIKKPLVINHTFFTATTFSKFNFSFYIYSIATQHL